MSPEPLGPHDLYLYLHGNGAVTAITADGRSRFVTLAEAGDEALTHQERGGRVLVGADADGLAPAARSELTGRGIDAVHDPTPAPYTWNDGADALIAAAAFGRDAILDDLIARGADVGSTDSAGATALHHAAGTGNLHAIDALAAAGADLDASDSRGMRAVDIARARGETAAVARLAALGASTDLGGDAVVRFRPAHMWLFAIWPLLALIGAVLLAVLLWPLSTVDVAVIVVAMAAYNVLVMPPPGFWAGLVPRSLNGSVLTGRTATGGLVDVDLTTVTLAGAGGATGRFGHRGGRWLILAHPAGHPVGTDRHLRRLSVRDADERRALLESGSPLLVVPIDGYRKDEVLLPVGNLLATMGVPMLPSLAGQVARARRARDSG